jgi:lipid-A-disaccharide synthase-like uncharacterized protein
MSSTDRDPTQQLAYFVMLIGGLGIVVFALLNPRPTALTWIEAALGVFTAVCAVYLFIRSRRQRRTPNDD